MSARLSDGAENTPPAAYAPVDESVDELSAQLTAERFKWQWQDDGDWMDYTPEDSDRIEAQFVEWATTGKKTATIIVLASNGNEYEIFMPKDEAWRQENMQSRFPRPVRRVRLEPEQLRAEDAAEPRFPQWQWRDKRRAGGEYRWMDYPMAEQRRLEAGFAAGASDPIRIYGGIYCVSLVDMLQLNPATHHGRAVRRLAPIEPTPPGCWESQVPFADANVGAADGAFGDAGAAAAAKTYTVRLSLQTAEVFVERELQRTPQDIAFDADLIEALDGALPPNFCNYDGSKVSFYLPLHFTRFMLTV